MARQGQIAQSLQEKASPGRQTHYYIFPESHHTQHMPGIVKTAVMPGARSPRQKMILKPWHTSQFVYLTNI